MRVSILIVTFERDFLWLKCCLKSIAKFATGFHEVIVAIPEETPFNTMSWLFGVFPKLTLRLAPFEDWPGKGFVRHMDRIMHADEICPDSDFILHMDADCIFTEPVRPDDYFVDGKPVLITAPYEWIVRKFNNPHHLRWRDAVVNAIGGSSGREGMRRHPAVHHPRVYHMARALIEQYTGKPVSEHIRGTQETFPQGFAEFPTLAEVAWRHFRSDYHWIAQETDPWPTDKLLQFWSHGPIDKPQNVWQGGELHVMTPLEVFNRLIA